jgi:hypothetical protein
MVQLEKGNILLAEAYADSAQAKYPHLSDPIWAQARIAAVKGDDEKAILLFDYLTRKHGATLTDIDEIASICDGFVTRDVYMSWFDTVQIAHRTSFTTPLLATTDFGFLGPVQSAQWDLCKKAIANNDFAKAVRHCAVLVDELGLAHADISHMVTDYRQFKESAEFISWYNAVDLQ